MTNSNPTSLPAPAFLGGTQAITLTPVVGAPRREYAEMWDGTLLRDTSQRYLWLR